MLNKITFLIVFSIQKINLKRLITLVFCASFFGELAFLPHKFVRIANFTKKKNYKQLIQITTLNS